MSKAKVAVVVDSTAYIPPALVAQYNIHVIPQILNWEGSSLRDDVDIKPDAFYARLANAKEMPTTSQPSAGEFHEFFSKVAETAESIVAVLISKSLSGTQASAQAAADMMSDYPIEIVDSESAAMGLGYMALAAARAAEAGADYQEAAAAARALVKGMRVLFVVDTLEFLHRGGRIGGAQRLIGSMLSIKPILHLVDGKIEPLASVRTKKKALAHLMEVAKEEMGGKSGVKAAVIHAAAADDAQSLHAQLSEILNPEEMHIVELSPVVGAHVGPKALGVVFYAA
ncbi:MAG: DegV family protein [Ardenticatenaceae bacterium]|nr:DegV family protein [Ardenticatenaceae bacterium]MCB8973608.1 DegV family protein [Ardenticatenaceae bacterium]